MSKPFRDSSSGVGLDVVVTLPADVCEKIKREAKERGETVAGWRRAELVAAVEVECAAEVPPEEVAFDVRQALLDALATKRLDDLARRTLAELVAEHLGQARLRFTRKAPLPLHSTGRVIGRVARALGEWDGTGPDDTPWLRAQREETRVRTLKAFARRLLASRGTSGADPRLDPADLRGVADEEVADALLRSEDGADFRARLARLRTASPAGEADGS